MLRLRFEQFAPVGKAFHLARVGMGGRRHASLHTHVDFAEVFWVEKGEGWHELNGLRKRIRSGDMFMIRAKDRHRIRPMGRDG